MNERLKQIRKYFKLSQEGFGKRIGVTKTAVSKMELGTYNMTDTMTILVCKEFGIEYLWLTTGEGEMFCNTDLDVMARIDYIMAGEATFAKETFKRFARLDDDDWKDIERIMNKLLDK